MRDLDTDSKSGDLIVNSDEKEHIAHSSTKCPFLKCAPLVPFADRYYFYCHIMHGKQAKLPVTKIHASEYCCTPIENLAYFKCPIWQDSPHNL
jgi:hypothetical protein